MQTRTHSLIHKSPKRKARGRKRLNRKQSYSFEPLESRRLLSADGIVPHDGGVQVTQTSIITPHDTIPRFGASPTVFATANGDWSNASIWSNGLVPSTDAIVSIPDGFNVTYDVYSDVELDVIEVSGTLGFDHSVNTSLWLNELVVLPSGTLTVGTSANPIDASVSAEIVFTDTPGENGFHFKTGSLATPGIDPLQYGNGLLVFGEFTTHGVEKTPYVRATDDILRGETSIQLSSVPADWQAGDTLLLPQTSQTVILKRGVDIDETEEVVISAIDGNTIRLTQPVQFDHLGIADNPFDVERYAHIGNLTRNIVLRSENGEGVRGHVFLTATADVDVDNTSFIELGRTNAELVAENTVLNDSNQVVRIGANQAGRYAFHAHHLQNPFELSGSVVVDGWRWGITVHNTDNSLVENNIVYDAAGAGIVTESGTETGNVFTGNLVIKVEGGHQVKDKRGGVTRHNDDLVSDQIIEIANDGSAFWFRATAGVVESNFVYDAAGYGYNFNGYYRTLGDSKETFELQQLESFRNNEVAASLGGLWLTWSQGQADLDSYSRQILQDLLVWHVGQDGVHAYHDANVTLQGITVIADAAVSNLNEGSATLFDARSTKGLNFGNRFYENFNFQLEGIDVSGTNFGIIAPIRAGQEGTSIESARIESHINIVFPENADRTMLSMDNVEYIPSRVIGIADSVPLQAANIWHEGIGIIEAGQTSFEIPPTPSLPAEVDLREDGRLIIYGNEGVDELIVSQEGSEIILNSNGSEFKIDVGLVSLIDFRARGGDDLFTNFTNIRSSVLGGDGNDELRGGSSADYLVGGSGEDIIHGGNGDDVVYGGDGRDILFGGSGNDKLRGEEGNDWIHGGDGDDEVLDGGGGMDLIFGGNGDDRLNGGGGDDRLFGEAGNDGLQGGEGNDEIHGGLGNDTLYGDLGRDDLFGGEGVNKFRPGLGADKLFLSLLDIYFDLDEEDELIFV